MAYGPNPLDMDHQSACAIGHTLPPLCRGSHVPATAAGPFLAMSDLTKQTPASYWRSSVTLRKRYGVAFRFLQAHRCLHASLSSRSI
jgi:hypothetical protein